MRYLWVEGVNTDLESAMQEKLADRKNNGKKNRAISCYFIVFILCCHSQIANTVKRIEQIEHELEPWNYDFVTDTTAG